MVKFKKKKDPQTADVAKSVIKEPLAGTVKKINKKKNKIKQEKQKNKKLFHQIDKSKLNDFMGLFHWRHNLSTLTLSFTIWTK